MQDPSKELVLFLQLGWQKKKSLKIYREIKPIKKIPPSNTIKKISRGTAAFTSILHWPIFLIFLEHCAPFLTWTAESWEGKDDRLLTEQVWNTVPRNSLGLLLTFQEEKKHLFLMQSTFIWLVDWVSDHRPKGLSKDVNRIRNFQN